MVTVPRHSCWVALPSATCNSLCNAGLALPVVLRLTALDASGENSSFAAQQSHSPMPPYVSSPELAPCHLQAHFTCYRLILGTCFDVAAGLPAPGRQPCVVAWYGATSHSPHTIEVPLELAACLQLRPHTLVAIQPLTGGREVPSAVSVEVEPASESDWEVLEVNAGHVEDVMLQQVGWSVGLLGAGTGRRRSGQWRCTQGVWSRWRSSR